MAPRGGQGGQGGDGRAAETAPLSRAAAHRFDPTILREYDIRGTVGETLGPEDARAVGRAYATMLAEKGGRWVAVGRDGRLSSPALEAALVEGLVEGGARVARIGLGPTPMLYFAVHHLAVDGGLMITGSHNPPDQNGIKMVVGAAPLYAEGIRRLGDIASRGAFASGAGSAVERPVLDAYVDRLARDYAGRRPLKVAWDAGNGAAGEAMRRLAARLPGTHLLLNERIDGTFPAHHPDPTIPENLEQLIELVRRERCDLGLAFDGDGDRLGVVDGEGEIVWADQIMVLLADDVLRRHPGALIIADVKASRVLFDRIAAAGGRPLMWKTGHSVLKAKMAEEGAPLAGEMSGHIFFKDGFYGHDDGLYVAVRLLSVLACDERSLADFRRSLPPVVNTPELRFPCPEERKFALVEEVAARLAAGGASVVAVDGVRVNTPDGWWLLRASNTQAVVVGRCEGPDPAALARLKAALAAELRASGLEPPPF